MSLTSLPENLLKALSLIQPLCYLSQIDEIETSWDQIAEFHDDKDAVRKYRALRLWLTDALNARSVSEAQDIIEKKIEDYESVLKKYRFRLAKGCFDLIFEPKFLMKLTGVSTVASLTAGSVFGPLIAGSILIGKIAFQIWERRIYIPDELRKNECEAAAILYEAKKLV
jgi:hypothetical protein